MRSSENYIFSEIAFQNFVFTAYLVRELFSAGKVHSETAPKIVQPSVNKLFSEKVAKNAVLAAYRVRGLFVDGQIAYGEQLGIVHSSENQKVFRKCFQKPLSRCLDLEGLLSCTLTIEYHPTAYAPGEVRDDMSVPMVAIRR